MSFFQELKRRNVFRVGVAYVVGAWLLLQFTEVITELLSLPPTIGPVVVALVAIGLPVALFLAWAYELTPDGVKREAEVDRASSHTQVTGKKLNGLIIGLLAVAVVVLLVDKFMLRDGGPADPRSARDGVSVAERESAEDDTARETFEREPGAAAAPTPAVDPRSIAVLPFTNRSPVAEDEFFIEGIHDDLLTNLARIGDLKVISRTSVMRFKDTATPIPEIAATLGVATIMEGAVQRAGDMVRINVQLINAETDEHLWAQIYDRELTTQNLFDIQSEIAGHIAEALQTRLTPDEVQQLQSQPTDNLAAYSAYLRGLRAFERREIESMQLALAEFQRAVELDPGFAHAWAGIAQVATVMPSWGGMTAEEGRAIAEPAAERALALAPNLGEAHLARAVVLTGKESEVQFQRAIELLPNSAKAHQWYGNEVQQDVERFDEAEALFRKAVELDPLAPIYRHQVARHLIFQGRMAEAEVELQRLVEVDPEFFPAVSFMSIALTAQGKIDESVQWLTRAARLDPNSDFAATGKIFAFFALKDRERLARTLESLRDQDMVRKPQVAALAAASLATLEGRFDAALESFGGIDDISAPGFDTLQARAYLHLVRHDYVAARRLFETLHPGFFAADGLDQQLKTAPQDACYASYILLRTGSAQWGQEVLERTLEFVENELPTYIKDADVAARQAHCLAIKGEFDAAMAALEREFEVGAFHEFPTLRYREYFEPLFGDPRFESLMSRYEEEIARQRARLDAWEAERADT